MKEIRMPVQILDDDCMTCELFNIKSVTKQRMYADDRCVSQEIEIQCDLLKLCEKIKKRLERK